MTPKHTHWKVVIVLATSFAAEHVLPVSSAGPPTERVVATSGDVMITSEQLEVALFRIKATDPGSYSTEEELRQLVNRLIRTRALANFAREKRLDQEPAIRLRIEAMLHDEIIAAEVDSKTQLGNISEDRIQRYYREEGATFGLPKRLGLHCFLVSRARYGTRTVEIAQDARRRADAAGPSLASFRTLAAEYGAGDDSGEMTELVMQAAEIEAAMRDPERAPLVRAAESVQKIGGIAQPVETSKGFFVVRLSDRSDERQQPLVEVREQIRQILYRKDRQEALDALLARAGLGAPIDVDRKELMKLLGASGRTSGK